MSIKVISHCHCKHWLDLRYGYNGVRRHWMIRLIWAIIWRGLVASTITWKVVGGPLSPTNYPKLENVQLVLSIVVLAVSFWLSAWYVSANKDRWLRSKNTSGEPRYASNK